MLYHNVVFLREPLRKVYCCFSVQKNKKFRVQVIEASFLQGALSIPSTLIKFYMGYYNMGIKDPPRFNQMIVNRFQYHSMMTALRRGIHMIHLMIFHSFEEKIDETLLLRNILGTLLQHSYVLQAPLTGKKALIRKEMFSRHLTEPHFGKCSEKHIFIPICSFKNNFFFSALAGPNFKV